MFEERFMDFGAFPGDFGIRRTSCTNRRLRDLGLEASAPSSASNGLGFCSSHGHSSPLSPIFDPFSYDQNQDRHLLKLNINDGTTGNDLSLCQSLSRMSISVDESGRSVLPHTGRFRVDPGGFGSRTVDGFHGSNGLSTSHGVSLGGGAYDDRSRLVRLQNDFNLNGCDHIIANDLLEQRNASYEQSWLNTGSCFRDDSVIPQKFPSDLNTNRSIQPSFGFNMNNVSSSSMTFGGNRIPQSLLALKGSGNLGLDDDSFIIPGSKFKVASKCIDFENDDRSITNQELLLSLASMIEIYGSVYLMAKDQNGCRFLQRIFEEGRLIEVTSIFNEAIDHVIGLSMDPFGNYFVQKLLDVCSEEQRMQIVGMMISKPGQLIRISLNTYGTRVVQKLIETLGTKQQIALMKSALKLGFLSLVRDLNGNHVIQRCLQSLSPEDNKFVFEAATKLCVEIATHRHGCCILQRCVSYAVGQQREKLIAEISKNALLLAQDPFGNYVVQYIIEQNVPAESVLCELKGHYVQLSKQKFSSHVVEKCLRHYPESRWQIVRELVSAPQFEQLLQDPFANYVIQSALAFTKGNVRARLVEEVKEYGNLRTSPYCKRIFCRSLLK